MKNIVLLILSLFTIFILILNPNRNYKNTEVVITIPNLTQKDLSYHLINEFSKYPNIEYVDGSLFSKTIVLNVNDNYYNQEDIENILHKWGCYPANFDYNNMLSYSESE